METLHIDGALVMTDSEARNTFQEISSSGKIPDGINRTDLVSLPLGTSRIVFLSRLTPEVIFQFQVILFVDFFPDKFTCNVMIMSHASFHSQPIFPEEPDSPPNRVLRRSMLRTPRSFSEMIL